MHHTHPEIGNSALLAIVCTLAIGVIGTLLFSILTPQKGGPFINETKKR